MMLGYDAIMGVGGGEDSADNEPVISCKGCALVGEFCCRNFSIYEICIEMRRRSVTIREIFNRRRNISNQEF